MEQYTDDERVEDLKTWWKDNGASILIGITLGILAIFGWQYWRSYRDAQAEKASQAYEAFVAAAEKPDAETARLRGQTVLTDFPKSPYAALAALRLAKLAVDGGDTAAAIQRLEWVITHARLDEIKDIARLRLARVQLVAGQLAETGKLLDAVVTAGLNAEREELRGDVFLAGNDPAKARTAYVAALAAGGSQSLLQMKIDNLAVPTLDLVVIAAPAPPPPPEVEPESVPVEPVATPAEPAPVLAPTESTPAPVSTLAPATTEPTSPESPPVLAPTESTPAPVSTLVPATTEPTPAEPVATPALPAPTASEQ